MTFDESLSFTILFEQNLILYFPKVYGFFPSSYSREFVEEVVEAMQP